MFLLLLILSLIPQRKGLEHFEQGREKETKHELAFVVSKVSDHKPWKKNVVKPTYYLITVDPLAMKLALSYRDASRLAMRTLIELLNATVQDLKRKSDSFKKNSKWDEGIFRLQKIVSDSDPKKFSESIQALREFALQPWWRKPPNELFNLTNETVDAWVDFGLLMESLWGSLESGDEGWFLRYSRKKKGGKKRIAKETRKGITRALLPRIGDALYFFYPVNPLPKWGKLAAFGKNGCIHSPKLLKTALTELARHIIQCEPDFDLQQSSSRYLLWNLFLKELGEPEFNFIQERLRAFASDPRAMEKMTEARIQSVLGLTVIMREVARNSLIIGRSAGAAQTQSKIYCLLMISKEVEEALADAMKSLKHSVKIGKRVVGALKRIRGVSWKMKKLLSGWDELDERLSRFKGYLDAIKTIRSITPGKEWKAVNKRGSLWDLVESVSSLDFIPFRPDITSNLAGRDANGVSELVPKNSWLRTFFKVEPWPHKLTIKFIHNGHQAFAKTGVPFVQIKDLDGKYIEIFKIWGWKFE